MVAAAPPAHPHARALCPQLAHMNDAVAPRASFRGVKMAEVSADGADFSKADFTDAALMGADFKGANLGLAKFDRADMTRGVSGSPDGAHAPLPSSSLGPLTLASSVRTRT